MSCFKVLITRRWPASVEAQVAERYDATLNKNDRQLSSSDLRDALARFDFIMPTITDRITVELIAGAPLRARALCNFGAGVNYIDLNACAGAGLLVTNTPDVLTDDTADLALLLALMCARRAGEGERLVRAGVWGGWAPTHLLGHRLSGRPSVSSASGASARPWRDAPVTDLA